jgi:hypothetical protein
MLNSSHPSNSSLDSESESCVRGAPVAAKIEVPLIVLQIQPVFLDASFEHIDFVFALAAADDFAITEGSNQIGTERVFSIMVDSISIRIIGILK